ncbi:chondroadherin-like [Rhinatrema bivittatum]|uniref:chondroadherin-like n=1 Tax=Rhinatrema bivittatum TaxID=194408 RepID=UPI001129FAEE|nr:chondroadherin-like [Rhinatrema bivittatum]
MDRTAFLLRLSLLVCLITLLQACPQNCHCQGGDLQHIICDSAGLRKIPKVSEKTKLLNLQRNNFPKLATNSFREMKGLVSLHLQHCQIKEISTGAFRGLKQLVYLYLSNNDIRAIKQGAFNDLGVLTYLYMDHNKILDLPKGFLSPLVNLFVLQLSSNKIKEVRPGTFSGAKDLRWLYLSNNDISTIQPGSLDEVENLAIFHLDKNQLTSYPTAAMSKLRVVEDLKLSQNPLKLIPDYAFQSFGRYMESLYMDNMGLERFSDKAFTGVTTLKSLHMGNNKLSQLPYNFPYSKLENLTLSNNPWHCSCSLAPLRKWLESSSSRTNATCATPSQYQRQQLRDTSAFRSCRMPIKRSQKGNRH